MRVGRRIGMQDKRMHWEAGHIRGGKGRSEAVAGDLVGGRGGVQDRH